MVSCSLKNSHQILQGLEGKGYILIVHNYHKCSNKLPDERCPIHYYWFEKVFFLWKNLLLSQKSSLVSFAKSNQFWWKEYCCCYSVQKHLIYVSCVGKGARTDLRNNEKKLALDMATNAACATLLKKKQGTGIFCFVLLL